MRGASAGEEFVYCEAPSPIRGETWSRAGELATKGLILTLTRKRAGGGFVYFARRTSRPLGVKHDPVAAALADPATDAIFRALKRAANFGRPCPTDTELMRLAGLNMRQAAAWRVRRLIDLKLIQSTLAYEGGVPTRVVTIVATGKFTALPKKWAALQQAAELDARAAAGGAQ
jgi:hypothetical protein